MFRMVAIAGLSTAGCALADAPDGQRQAAEVASPAASAIPDLHPSIVNPSGKAIFLAGKAGLAATNAWLANRGEHFVAGFPEGFPPEYWGIDPTVNAYVFVNVYQYDSSLWSLDGVERTGRYAELDLTIYGFRTDAAGHRIDVTGDGIVDDEDWIGLQVQTTLSGSSISDSAQLAAFYRTVFGVDASTAVLAITGIDGAGYPGAATVIAPGQRTIALAPGAANPNRCTPDAAEWERCWYWNAFNYHALTLYPAPRSLVKDWSFAHDGNNWIKFDRTTDTFEVAGSPLGLQLAAIGFQPAFWVRARDFSSDFLSDASPLH